MSRYESAVSGWVYWVLPAAFVLHDAEELATMPAWVASHRSQIETLLSAVGAGDAAAALPTTFARAGVAIGCMMIVFVVITAGVWSRPASPVWRVAYGGLLGAFFLHAFTHMAQSVAFGGYTPGVVSAVVIVVPASVFVYRKLTRRGALKRRPTAVASSVALLLFVPAVLLAYTVAAWLAPG
ncbi:MAG TPA: HXXEE domain-containing protein [Blastocatellia bacterium]|nr:HXXEE domain-containing protein [Blastocatellia bacterium]